ETVEITLPVNQASYTVETCDDRTAQDTPYSLGFWLQIQSAEDGYVSVETVRHYGSYVIAYYNLQQKEIDQDTKISVHNSCKNERIPDSPVDCDITSDDVDDYILSSLVLFSVKQNVPKYVFISKPFNEEFSMDLPVVVTHMTSSCGVFYQEILWNDIILKNGTKVFLSDRMLKASDACLPYDELGKWFLVRGVDQSISISTCDSPPGVEVGFNVIAIDNTETIDKTLSCGRDNANAQCVTIGSKTCGTSDLEHSAAVVTLSPTKNYFILVTTSFKMPVTITLSVNAVCPMDCGEHGICSTSQQKCICDAGYVNKNGVCSLCGNGKYDSGYEECDTSNFKDVLCDSDTCMCFDGYSPKSISGITKCSLSTCGDNEIGMGEQCDGGVGCDHCVCDTSLGYRMFQTPRKYCLSSKCGNGLLDDGEEGV
ncbi:protein kinase domain containing protein, partial [Entamoeba invadens IP1]